MRRWLFPAGALVGAVFSFMGCEPQLPRGGEPVGAGEADGGLLTPDSVTFNKVSTTLEGEQRVSKVDAVASDAFTALDLETGRGVPFDENAWDLAFQRYHVRARGGASGDGGVQVAVLKQTSFASVTQEFDGGWLEDQPDGEDTGADLDTVFERPDPWFNYDVKTHVLSPQPYVYVVKSDQGAQFKLQIQRYYDEAGTPGVFTLRWEPLPLRP